MLDFDDLGEPPELTATVENIQAVEIISQHPLESHTASVMKDIQGAKAKPSHITQDVWEIREEYIKKGGLADLSEQLASLAEMERDVRAAGLTLQERTKLLIQINQQAVSAKSKYVAVQEKLRNFITFDVFSMFLEELHHIIIDEVHEPLTCKRIGIKLAKAAERLNSDPGT